MDHHIRFNGGFTDENLISYMDAYLEDEYAFITSPRERAILNQRSTIDQIIFRSNAISASLESIVKFNMINCQDNACNAYRHAFFNALNAEEFSTPVARSLGQAREGNRMIDPVTLRPTNFVCHGLPNRTDTYYMDLFNNEQGYKAVIREQQRGGNLSAIVWSMSQNYELLNAPACP